MSNKSTLARSALVISICTLASKLLGFFREVMIADRFGSGMETDTYFIAMTATVIVVGTLGAALNTTLIPIFTEIEKTYGRKGKLKYLNNILNLVILIALVIMVLGYFFSPQIIRLVGRGFKGDQFDLAVSLNRIGLPIVLFLGFTYVFSGLLHSSQIFGPPAISGIPYNIVFLVYLFFFAKSGNIKGLMLVSVLAASSQFLIMLPAVRHMGYRYSPRINLRDPYLKKAMVLVIPVLLGSTVQQINTIIDKTLATSLVEGSLSALTYASRINDMVVAVFIMALTTVIFPMLSAAFAKDDLKEVKDILGQGVNIVLLITVPATVGLILMAEPAVYLFFERNAFKREATIMTSQALTYYSIGLVGASLRLMLNKVYYSLQDTGTPMKNGIVAVFINVVLNFLLIGKMAHKGLALATSISAIMATGLLLYDLRKKIGPLGISAYIKTFIKVSISSLLMGVLVYLSYYVLGGALARTKTLEFLFFLGSVGLGIVSYFVACLVLRVEGLDVLIKKVKK